MKKLILILVSAIVLLLRGVVPAQGTLYVSNLGLTSVASGAIGSDSWLAQGFFTGNNAGGYVLNSAQLLMAAAAGNPSGFTVSLYSASYSSQFPQFATPGNSIDNLTGSDPSVGGLFTYTDSSSFLLLPSTSYFIVITANTPVTTGTFEWSAAQNITGQSLWLLDNVYFSSTEGSNWSNARNHLFQLGIYATAVPEPSTLCLTGLGGIIGGVFFKNRRKKCFEL